VSPRRYRGVGKQTLFSELPRRVLLGNLRVSGHKKRPGSCGLQPFSILLYSVRYRLPLIVRVIMKFLFQKPGFRNLVPVSGEMGKGKGGGHQGIGCIPTAYMF
jgi:hypothetical protein